MFYNKRRSLANVKTLQLSIFLMELPRDLSKLKAPFRKPLTVDNILNELYDNEPHFKYRGSEHREPEVILSEGLRFAFVFSPRHNGPFLFVECTNDQVDREWCANRPDRFQAFILMDIYAIVGGGHRV